MIAAGSLFGRWRLDALLGSGGLADVWEAADGDERVAIKILREPDRSSSHRARFLREGRLLQRLDHPGLPRCLAVSPSPRPYLALELLRGRTLSARLREVGPLPLPEAEALAAALLRVLDYLHGQGIVHRDIKPSNIYLTEDGRVLLLDLGLAADPSDPLTTTLGDVMGTYAYMAPEQIAGAEVDRRCDMYSLGVSLYEALAGNRPFHARGASGYLRAHREGLATPLRELVPEAPARLVETIGALMARDPQARPASAAVARALLSGAPAHRGQAQNPPLLGRAAAIGAVEAALDGGGVILLLGEIGAGAGRMAQQALEMGRSVGAEVLAIRCRPRAHPMDPIEQLARDLRQICGGLESGAPALVRAADSLAREGPTLVVVEDTELCSPEAAQVLRQLAEGAPGLALICTGVRGPPHLPGHTVRLRPLSLEEMERLLAGMLDTPTPPAGLSAELHRMSGGLPALAVLAIKELIGRRALWWEGVAEDGRPVWKIDRSVSVEPRAGLVRLFGQTLQSLPDEARAVLEVLAVVGEALPVDQALELAAVDPAGLSLGPLLTAGLIGSEAHDDGDQIMLRRPAVGSLVLAQVPASRQRDIHARLARQLQQEAPGPWRDQRLAWHSAHGAQPAEAPAALLELGEELHRRGQSWRALEVLGRAAQIPGLAARIAATLAIARGEILDASSRREEAAQALHGGRRLAEEIGAAELLGRALVAQAQLHHSQGDERRAALVAEEALELLEQRPADPSFPQALLIAANSHRLGARPEQAAQIFQRCLDVATQQGNPGAVASARGGLGALYAEEGQLEEALALLEQESLWLRTAGLSHRMVPTLYRQAIAWRRLGQCDRSLACLEEAEDICRYASIPYDRALVRVGQASVHLVNGDIEGSGRWLDQARMALDSEASVFLRLAWREIQAALRLAQGDRQAALAVYHAAESEAQRAGYASASSFFLGMIGVLTADAESITQAMDVLSTAGDRRLAALLLLQGAVIGGDPEVLGSAEQEARDSGDIYLLLDVLHASGGASHQQEAADLARAILRHLPVPLRPSFQALPAVRWALSEPPGRLSRA